MRLAMESHTGGMPLCGLGAPETERVGATRSHDVEVGHTMGPPSERSHAASRNAITPRRSGLTTANRLRYPSSTEATPELFHGTRDTTLLIPRCWFDAEKCRVGLEALTFYRKAFNERLQTFTDKPLHDWTSHAADAFRGLAVRHKPPRSERSKQRRPSRKRDLWAGRLPPAGRQGWMH